MLVLGLDLETTGMDANTEDIIEIGAVLWDVERKKPVKLYSEMILCEKPIPEEIVKLTGIRNEDVAEHAIHLQEGMSDLKAMAEKADYIVAHNGNEFDKKFIEAAFEKHPETYWEKKWIDTSMDIPYPKHISTRKLTHLAAEHQFLNPFSHRALFDVLTMMQVFSHYPIEEILSYAESETKTLVALVSFEEKDLAKKQGFRWNPQERVWYKKIKELDMEKQDFPFATKLL